MSTGGVQLGERTLRVRHAVITSLAVVTPTGAIFFITIPAAANAGTAMPLAFLIAFVAVLLIVNAIVRFAQHVSDAGSFFAFVREALGPRPGFFAGWLFLAFYPLVQAFSLVIFGAFVEQILRDSASVSVPWWAIALAGLAAIWGLSVLGIKLSIRSDLALLVFEGLVLGALAATILLDGGADGLWHPEAFDPARSAAGAGGIALAVVFGIQSFTGFEAASYLGEEAEDPRRTIPRGMLLTTVLAGVIYVVFAYIAVVGWGPDRMEAYAQSAAPWHELGLRYWNGDLTVLIDVAAAVAALAGGMASQNGAARMLYALGRDGLLPAGLARTSARFGTPAVALTALAVAVAAIALGLGLAYDPLSAFSLLGLVVTFSALGVYFLAQIACFAFFRRRPSFEPLGHLLVPLLAVGVIGYLFYRSFWPVPPAPLNLAIWIALGWALVGLAVIAVMSATRPERFARLTRILGEDEPGEPAVHDERPAIGTSGRR